MVKKLVLIIGVLWVFSSCACAAEKIISYLPRNEDMQNKSVDYTSSPRRLNYLNCTPAENLFDLVSRCNYCVLDLQKNCPDCCLNLTVSPFLREIKCSSGFNCKTMAFETGDSTGSCTSTDCSILNCLNKPDCQTSTASTAWSTICANETNKTTLNHCQQYGCPNSQPNDNDCVYISSGGYWRCDKNNLLPKYRGCTSHNPSVSSPYWNGNDSDDYYNIVEDWDCVPNPTPPPTEFCDVYYNYTPKLNFISAINACKTYVNNNVDTCLNQQHCCKRAVCTDVFGWPPAPNTPGPQPTTPDDFVGYNTYCDNAACQTRVDYPDCQDPASPNYQYCCDNFTTQTCADLNKAATDCLVGGNCTDCFQAIDNTWSYRFVARSRQAATIIWQIATLPNNIPGAPTYFYTRVRVYELAPGGQETLVHQSVPHQKSLEAAFSIYAATHIPAGTLEQGKAYLVKVFYFLPKINDPLTGNPHNIWVDITSMQLIVITTRE